MKIIIINGSAAVGKNTFVRLFRERLGYAKVHEHSTVDTIKRIMVKFFGYPGDHVKDAKTDKARRCMSDLKDAWTAYNDGPFNEIVMHYDFCITNGKEIMIIHCREPEEIKRIVDNFEDCTAILIDSSERVTHVPDNHADQNVNLYEYDYIIDNNGTEEDLTIGIKTVIADFLSNDIADIAA